MKKRKLPEWIRCPECRETLVDEGTQVVCNGKQAHRFPKAGDIIKFAPQFDIGKYNKAFASKYAGLWAYGYEILNDHPGGCEGLYRTVTDLATDFLIQIQKTNEKIKTLDLGCGVGRIVRDLAHRFPSIEVVGLDGSLPMLQVAFNFVVSSEGGKLDISETGYLDPLRYQGAGLTNVTLLQGDAAKTPFEDGTFSLVTCVNLIDRAESPQQIFREIARLLRPGGHCILTSPLNWDRPQNWRDFPNREAVRKSLADAGLSIIEWFDGLVYRGYLDARGNYTDWNTLVIVAKR